MTSAPSPISAPPSTPAPAGGDVEPPGTATRASARPSVRRRVLTGVVWLLGIVGGGLLIALVAVRPAPADLLHPDGVGPGGSRALVEVLREHGISVDVVSTSRDAVDAAGPGTTVVVGNSDRLTDAAARRLLSGLRGSDRLVFLDAAPGVLGRLGLGLRTRQLSELATEGHVADSCGAPWATAGDLPTHVGVGIVADDGGLPSGATGCFAISGQQDSQQLYGAVELAAQDGRAAITVVGFPSGATNRWITDGDNAGLLVRMLGGSPHLVWLHPTLEDVAQNPSEAPEVWPAWLGSAIWLVASAFVVFALARGRRLGRLVPEPLPVVVEAAETTHARAELYRSGADHARAAVILRRATATRLNRRLGLPARTRPDQLIPLVATSTGIPDHEVARMLLGPLPGSDQDLVTLAQQLAHLEEKVRNS